MKQETETRLLQRISFQNSLSHLNDICKKINQANIDTILFGKWAASLYAEELSNMGTAVLLVPAIYLNEKRALLDSVMNEVGLNQSPKNKFLFEDPIIKVMFESQGILSGESQTKRNTVWREINDLKFKTRSASSILADYEDADKPEHDEIRKKLRAYIESRRFISKLAKNIILNVDTQDDESSTARRLIQPSDLIYKILQALENTPYATPQKKRDELAEILEATENQSDDRKNLNSKRVLLVQAICERLNIQTYLLRFSDAMDRFKSSVCVEILLNNHWFLIDPSVYNTTILKVRVRDTDRYNNQMLKLRGLDCFEIGLGEIEQQMANEVENEERNAGTIAMPDFEQEEE